MRSAGSALLDAFTEAGVTHLFANFGSDHPSLVEAIARARSEGARIPEVLTCPNEMVAMSAAHGHAMLSGRAQAVIVHVDCGTQSLAGAVHNADKGRVPVLVFAGASPFSQDGELRGGRNEFIQWIQDVHDQRGIVRGYMRYDAELRSGRNLRQMVHRALQFAHSEPQGPVYLMAAREVMEEAVDGVERNPGQCPALEPCALPPQLVQEIAHALGGARRPLIVTSYAGRNSRAPEALMRLCEEAGIAVLESVPSRMNFPHDHPLYLGNQWNQPAQNPALAEADLIIVLDSDVPWIPAVNRPSEEARIFHIDVDPLKMQMPLWYLPSVRAGRADAETVLGQLHEAVVALGLDRAAVGERTLHYHAMHEERARALRDAEARVTPGLSPEFFLARLRLRLDERSIVLNEAISSYQLVFDHLAMSRPGSMFTSGGGSLGWNGGAAVGAKLAAPDKDVIAISGDGSYMFSAPSSVHWIARRYKTPFLQIVLNNGGWKSPKLSTLALHPDGYASGAPCLDTSFEPPPDYGGIAAAAGGALALSLDKSEDVDRALDAAFRALREEARCTVLDVKIDHH